MNPRRGYYVACLAFLLAAVMGGGAGYLHAKHASAEAAGLFLLALAVVVLGACAVPPSRDTDGDGGRFALRPKSDYCPYHRQPRFRKTEP